MEIIPVTAKGKSGSISAMGIRLMYRAIFVALMSSVLTVPIALFASYESIKARHDRIFERQVDEVSRYLFSKMTPGVGREVIEGIIAEFMSAQDAKPSPDADFVFISLSDEFGQGIAEKYAGQGNGRAFNRDDIDKCSQAFIPIITYGSRHYFCSSAQVVNGYAHYKLFGVLRASDRIVSDFIQNTLVLCGTTSLIVIIVSIFQYYVSLRVSKTLMRANVKTLLLLGNTIALRDNDTFHHNLRVMIYSYYFGIVVRLREELMNDLISGALLHDIGKIGIPDSVLQKPGRLTAEEFRIIKGHVALGEQIMINSEWANGGIDVIKYHHERFDGAGYPNKAKANDIPLIARMFAIVDVFDAITSERPYKKPRSYEDTMSYLLSAKGGHFDAELVDGFVVISRMLYERYANRNDDVIVGEANRILNVYYG
jgi:HD-GYP domain-containing protein (c-di-GMP phosphodiesterase class II)